MKTLKKSAALFIILLLYISNIYPQSGWVQQNSGTTGNLIYFETIDGYTAYTGNPSFKTTDGGNSWTGISFNADEMQMINSNIWYAVYSEDLKTTNAGANWQIITGNHFALDHQLSFINELTGMVGGIQDQNELDLHKTTNGGNTWILYVLQGGEFPDGGRINDIKCLNSSVVYISFYYRRENPWPPHTDYYLWKSTNGGNIFDSMMQSASMKFYEMQFPSANTGFVIAVDSTGNKIIKSVNDNWGANICFSTSHTIKGIEFPSVNTGYAICDSGLVYKTTNSGTNWFALNTGTSRLLRDIKFINNLTGWIVGDSGLVLKTTTGGEIPVEHSVSGLITYQDNNDPVTSGYVKAIRYDSATFSIVTVDSAQIQPNGAYTLPHCPPVQLDIMAYENDEEELSFVPTYYISTIYWRNSTHIMPDSNLSNINIAVKRITNLGDNFYISGYIYNNSSGDYTGIKDAIIYSRSAGVFKSHSISLSNGFYKVDSLSSGVYELIVDRMGFESSTYVLAITNSSLNNVNFYLDNSLVPVKQIEIIVPDKFKLEQNYPNPFNPVTSIRFSIPEASKVEIILYDILGRKAAVLINSMLMPGTYEAEFNGTNYPSGIYFYTMTAGTFKNSKKMILIK